VEQRIQSSTNEGSSAWGAARRKEADCIAPPTKSCATYRLGGSSRL
jgi:hypothetical protein